MSYFDLPAVSFWITRLNTNLQTQFLTPTQFGLNPCNTDDCMKVLDDAHDTCTHCNKIFTKKTLNKHGGRCGRCSKKF